VAEHVPELIRALRTVEACHGRTRTSDLRANAVPRGQSGRLPRQGVGNRRVRSRVLSYYRVAVCGYAMCRG
jgi:hypothetical protein